MKTIEPGCRARIINAPPGWNGVEVDCLYWTETALRADDRRLYKGHVMVIHSPELPAVPSGGSDWSLPSSHLVRIDGDPEDERAETDEVVEA